MGGGGVHCEVFVEALFAALRARLLGLFGRLLSVMADS